MLRNLFVLHKASRLCVELCTVFLVFSRFGAAETLRESFLGVSGQMMLLKHVLKELSVEAYEAEHEMSSCLSVPGFENVKLRHVHVLNLDDCLDACLRLWQYVGVLLPKISERCNREKLLTLDDLEVQELSVLSVDKLHLLREKLDDLYECACSCRVLIE
jgi:hypothetical protein